VAALTPPVYPTGNNTFYWSFDAYTTNWNEGDNWYNQYGPYNGIVPIAEADIVLGVMGLGDDPQTLNLNGVQRNVRSLWFGNEANYTITTPGSGPALLLGAGLANNGHLITVLAEDAVPSRVHTLDVAISLQAGTKTFQIGNYSPGSLLFKRSFAANGNSLTITNLGTLTFQQSLSGLTNLTITDSDSTTFDGEVTASGAVAISNAQTTHFKQKLTGITDLTITDSLFTNFYSQFVAENLTISISGASPSQVSTAIFSIRSPDPNQTTNSNTVTVGPHANVIFARTPLGGYTLLNTNIEVKDGGTFTAAGLYIHDSSSLKLTGDGLTRQAGTAAIGALYSTPLVSIRAPIQLNGDTAIGAVGSRSGLLRIHAPISEASGQTSSTFKKVGSGLVDFMEMNLLGSSPTNTWKGATQLNKGVVRIRSLNGLPSGNLVLNGGILELGKVITNNSFLRDLGTGQNQVQWTGSGGFSAYERDSTVSIGSGTLTWGSGNFVPDGSALLLGSRYGTHQITLTNAIDLGSQLREVRVERGLDNSPNLSTTSLGRLSGALSGAGGGIEKTGQGLLWILGPAKTYTGATLIRDGALRGNIPNASNLQLAADLSLGHIGGVFGVQSGTFTRALGTANNQVQWLGSGGFAAYGNANRTVRLGGSTAEIDWGAAHFVQTGQELRFGHYSAERAVVWDKALNFGDAMRTIRVERGKTANTPDVIFAQALRTSATTGGLRLVGDGRADLTVNNSAFNAAKLEIAGAELRIANAAARLGPVGNIALSEGGRFVIDNTDGPANSTAQVAATTAITLNSGEIHYRAHTSGAVPSVTTVGAITLESGANTVALHRNTANQPAAHTAQINTAALNRNNSTSRATLDLAAANDPAGATLLKSVASLAANMIGGIIPWATVNGRDWAFADGSTDIKQFTAYQGSGGGNRYAHITAPFSPSISSGTVNSLKVTSVNSYHNDGWKYDQYLGLGSLTLTSGGLLATGSYSVAIGGGSITTAQNRPLYIHSNFFDGNGNFYSSSVLSFEHGFRFLGGMDVVKTGRNALRYNSGGTSQIGSLYVHQGRVEIAAGKFQTTGQVHIGDGSGRDELLLGADLRDPLVNKPRVNLHGTPYRHGAKFDRIAHRTDEAVLSLGANTHQTLAQLHIIDRGSIDFAIGTAAQPSFLFLDLLTFNNADAQLFVHGWLEYQTYLLVKKTAFAAGEWAQKLKQIWFDGYSLDFGLLNEDYNADYYQITPFAMYDKFPEPSTYGAILGAVGLALVAWRKHKRRRVG